MAYNENNSYYQQLTEDERNLVGLEDSEREECVKKVLDGLADHELLQMCRDYNYWNGSFDFCDMHDADEFISMMTASKSDSELFDFIMDVADAVNEYEGSDPRSALWGYPNGYDLEIKDEDDLCDEAVDATEDLAYMIVSDGTYNRAIDDMPQDITDMLELWEQEDDGCFEEEDKDEDE